MANVHGKDIAVFLGDTDVYQYLNANSNTVNSELADISAYQDEDRNYLGGLITGQAVLGGHFDNASGAIADELENSLKTATLLSTVYGAALSDRWWGMRIQASDYSISDPVGDVVVVGYTAQADDGVSRGTILHPLANVETGADDETSVDQTTATSGGCVAFLHVTAFSGTDITILIEDAASDAGYATLVTFTQATGITSERVEIAAAATTPNRWVKTSWSGTFSSCTFVVGMARL